jgi:hypothetical protein
VWLISEPFGGSQGSIWFLRELEKNSQLIRAPLKELSQRDAWLIVRLALDSEHYMLEELRDHRDANTTDERTQTGFVHLMCDYLIWQAYFHAKLMQSRIINARHRRQDSVAQLLRAWYDKNIRGISNVKQQAFEFRAANLPRREVAERILQVRRGTIIPLMATAVVLIVYLCIQPLTYGALAPQYARTLSASHMYSHPLQSWLILHLAFGF